MRVNKLGHYHLFNLRSGRDVAINHYKLMIYVNKQSLLYYVLVAK